jgi:hypothetical protein
MIVAKSIAFIQSPASRRSKSFVADFWRALRFALAAAAA